MYKIIVAILFLSFGNVVAQDVKQVEVKGVGVAREDALQDALRNAVSEAIGVSLVSETKVENFMVIQDAIQTRSQGYISNYQVIKEVPFPNRFEITISANVSLSPLKADINTLAQSVGGIRFLVMYDERNMSDEDKVNYEAAAERINMYLSDRKYRYIDKSRFNALKKEAFYINKEIGQANEESYIQKLGFMADAQFIIFIKKISTVSKSEAFETRTSSKVSIEAKIYDNCTAEGLGTVLLESDWKGASASAGSTVSAGISEAVNNGFSKLLTTFTSYIGEWVNNGTPFELRFYSTGTYRDLRDLRQKLKDDKNFGGQIEIVAFDNYTKLNCTFKKKPDALADKVLDYSDEIPTLKDKRLDVKFIYGRQISFAPTNFKIPDLPTQSTENSGDTGNTNNSEIKTEKTNVAPANKTKTNTAPANKSKTAPAKTGTNTKTTTKTK